MKTLFVYTRSGCNSCIEAKDFLLRNSIPFKELDVDNDLTALEHLHRNGDKYLPQFYIDGKKFMTGGWKTVRTMRQQEILDRLK